jgi:uncharacterized membrane protein
MTSETSSGAGGSLKSNPAASALTDAVKGYAKARSGQAMKGLGQKLTGLTEHLEKSADGEGLVGKGTAEAAKKIAQGDSPVSAALSGAATTAKEKIKGAFGKGGGGGQQKVTNIVEDISIGVPVSVAYDQWTQFQEFSQFMKGVEGVDQTDEVSTNWRVKVFKSRRSWKANVTEQIPDRRIAWTSEGAKGSTKGVVTFHPLADDLTKVLLVLEYYPSGFFEKTGNIWRAGGRRARLDLKHFRRFVMMRGEATGSWRGEIRDGEVVRGPDEEEQDQERPEDQTEEQPEDQTEDQGEESDESEEESEEERERQPA